MADWLKIKNEYIHTSISTRKLAQKHDVSASAVMKKSAAEKWSEERKVQGKKIEAKVKQKTASRIASNEASRIARLLAIGDKLALRLDHAADELDQMTLKRKLRQRDIEYRDPQATGKPSREIVLETEAVEIVKATIDRQGLNQLSATLKNLKDVARTGSQSEGSDMLAKAQELLGGVNSVID